MSDLSFCTSSCFLAKNYIRHISRYSDISRRLLKATIYTILLFSVLLKPTILENWFSTFCFFRFWSILKALVSFNFWSLLRFTLIIITYLKSLNAFFWIYISLDLIANPSFILFCYLASEKSRNAFNTWNFFSLSTFS